MISIGITSYVNTNLFERLLDSMAVGSVILEFIAVATPFCIMSLAFAFAYSFIPNTRVQFSSAVVGGIVTTIIWKTMGMIFKNVVSTTTQEYIYLAFATVIIVMVFIYIGWVVMLVGSSIAYYHQYPGKARSGREKTQFSLSQQEEMALTIASLIIQQFCLQKAPWTMERLMQTLNISEQAVAQSIDTLQQIGLITSTSDEPAQYLPVKSVEDCRVVDVWKLIRSCNNKNTLGGNDVPERITIQQFGERLEILVSTELSNMKFKDLN